MAILSPSPKLQFFDANGNPLVGGKLYTYAAGTTTPLATYTDSSGGTANTNPIILDSRGEANVWLASGTAYKFALQSAASVAIWTVDNIDATLGTMASQNANNVAITGGSITGLTTFTTTNGATIQGLTVGKGAGAVSTNTAVGASALAANTTGDRSVAIGGNALLTNSTGVRNVAVGYNALQLNTASYNTAVGEDALSNNSSGANNTAMGYLSLYNNTTSSRNTAVGYQAAYTSNGEGTTAVGHRALYSNTTGVGNSALGASIATVSGSPLESNTTGSYNTAVGTGSLGSNTTASNNTAVGYQAGYSNVTATYNTLIGYQTGYSLTGNAGTGANTFIGNQAGYFVTSGTKNVIIGGYGGNAGGLDIRTSSNYIVLSDGDGNPRIVNGAYPNTAGSFAAAAGCTTLGIGGTSATYDGILYLNGSNASGWGPCIAGRANGTQSWYVGSYSYVVSGTSQNLTCQTGTNGVQLASGATAWTSASDPRLKNITGTYENALADIVQIQPIKFTWKSDEDNKPCVGVDASTVIGVVPEAVDECEAIKNDETKYLHVRYTELIPLMIASIKELKAEIDILKGQA